MPAFSQARRKTVHILVGGFAFLLRYLTWWQAAALAAIAVLNNLFVLPRVAASVFHDGDRRGLTESGIVIYPIVVLAMILCFPSRPEIVAAAWAILAAGDGFATLVGAHLRTVPLPWNREKSVGGLIAFIVFGSVAGVTLALWTVTDATAVAPWWPLAAPIAAAVAAAFAETVPLKLNDNITVPAIAILVLAPLAAIEQAQLDAWWPVVGARLPLAAGVNAVFALLGWLAGTVTIAGAIAGFVIGVAVFAGTGWSGWIMLFATFLAAALTTRIGQRKKTTLGIAEGRGGRRGAGNAIANTGLAAFAALISIGVVGADLARLAMVAALVTAASDTVASEIGKAFGRTTWLVTTFRRVRPGTSGAVSLEGTAAGVVAALLLASVAVWLGLIPSSSIALVAAAATIAALVEGALGATLEARGTLNNDALNFVNALIGAGLAVAGAGMLA
ncbi:MAG TPA: DUF92 domain-containing protein [Vicinamibacterales bacterium]|nr:DUF92 domain-containing protein [Vicinamibacterales bacterium]